MKFHFCLFYFVSLLLQCRATYVVDLNADTFETYTMSGTWFIQFYTPWCGVCKKTLTIWEELAEKMRTDSSHCNIAIIDSDASPELNRILGITDYPSYLFFSNGKSVGHHKYIGEAKLTAFEQYIHDHSHDRPDEDREHITLRYFQSRGRAEIIRLTLEASGLSYEQKLHSSEEWPAIKKAGIESGTLPFGQVPAIRIDHRDLVQTAAIVRYIGGKHGLIPHEFKTQVDFLMGGVEDLRGHYSKLVYNKDFASKKDDYLGNILPVWLGHFERYLTKTTGPYLVGDALTVADLALFDIVTANLAVSADCLDDFKRLQNHVRNVYSQKSIMKYLLSDRRPPYQNGASAHFDNSKQPSQYWDTLKFKIQVL